MRTSSVRHTASLSAAWALGALVACGPSDVVGKQRLEPIKSGMTTAQVDAIIGEGQLQAAQPGDSLRLHKGYRTEMYLSGGKRYTVIWYREKAGSIEDEITRDTDTPILLESDTVMARGWASFDNAAAKLNLPNPYRSRERLDSMSRAQSKN